MQTGLFNITEAHVAKRLRLSRETVRDLRVEHLYESEDWLTVGREIKYTEDGLQKIRLILQKIAPDGVKLRDLAVQEEKPEQPAPDEVPVIMDAVVTKIFSRNPQYLEALLGGQPITVRVNSNVNFIPGMVIKSRLLAMKNPRVFDFIDRCPRSRGRW